MYESWGAIKRPGKVGSLMGEGEGEEGGGAVGETVVQQQNRVAYSGNYYGD